MDKLKYYLGTGLKFEVTNPKFEFGEGEYELSSIDLLGYVSLNGINVKTQSAELFHFEDVQFKMRPLSSLTKEITVEGYNGGEPFVPMIELAKMFHKSEYEVTHYNNLIYADDYGCSVNCCVENDDYRYMYYTIFAGIFITHNDFRVVQHLIRWHFYIGDQSEFGKSLIEIKE